MNSTVTLGGNPVRLAGRFPVPGDVAPAFTLVDTGLADVPLARYAGMRKVLSIVPSLDTPVCQASTRKFNERAGALPNTVVLVISSDLPFAMQRFCETAGLQHVVALSTLRGGRFKSDYGVDIVEGPLAGLTARAVVVLDGGDRVVHAQLVPEITEEPDYEAVLAALA